MTGKGRTTALAGLFVALCSGWALAMEAPASQEQAPEQQADRGVEEITVTGQRSIFILSEQVTAAEKVMYELYNELNTDDQYDIECKMETRLFSHTKKKICLPTYARRTMQREAQNRVRTAQGQIAVDTIPNEIVLTSKYPALDARFKELMQGNPDLFSAVAKHYELSEMLRLRRKTHFGADE